MHLIIPFASTVSEAGQHAQQSLQLPHLTRLLSHWSPVQTWGSDEYSLSPPHEMALAAARGWPLSDGALPFAADLAAAAGLPTGECAWALLTPVHLQVGSEQVSCGDPQALALSDADSRALLEALRPLFEEDGFALHWLSAQQWLASHTLFDALPTASLDRVAGRAIEPWLPDQRQARPLRRLQNEAQMLFHTQPANAAREAAGLPPVNSFWCSGCGRAATPADASEVVQVDDRLRQPALREDWAAWCEAWQALDAEVLATLQRNTAGTSISLCGERRATRWQAVPRPWWQRLAGKVRGATGADATTHLESL